MRRSSPVRPPPAAVRTFSAARDHAAYVVNLRFKPGDRGWVAATPFIPAEAGTQTKPLYLQQSLGSRLRGNDTGMIWVRAPAALAF
jgi:hypothetical protein